MKTRGETYFLVVVAAVALVSILTLARMEQFYAKIIPLVFSSLVFIFAIVLLWETFVSSKRAGAVVTQSETDRGKEGGSNLRGYMTAWSWMVGFVLGIYLLGLVIAGGVFVFSYSKSHGTNWIISTVLTVLTFAFAYGVFEVALRMPLYKGLLLTWVGY